MHDFAGFAALYVLEIHKLLLWSTDLQRHGFFFLEHCITYTWPYNTRFWAALAFQFPKKHASQGLTVIKKELLSQKLFREYGRFRYEKWLETEKLKIPYFSQSMSNSISLGDGYSNRHQSRLKSKKISFYIHISVFQLCIRVGYPRVF